MRGPEETMNAEDTTRSSSGEGSEGNEGRDPCSSPPFKRFKQAVLNFQSNSSTSNGSPPSSSPPNLSNGVLKEVIVIDDDNRTPNCGGLVTAAPSPPEKGHLKPQSSAKDQKDDEKQPDISYFTVPIDKPSDSPKSNMQEINCSPKQTSPNNTKTPLKPTSAEKKKLKEEKQKLKEEKERQRQEAKAQKEKEKLEAKQKKEQERLEKQAEKEKKEREKQEKKEKKEEERRKKEEEINAKLEEKRKKEEEKKQQEEELKRKKMQASLSFKSFFTKATNAPPKTLPKAGLKFEPFEIKPHMSLAPVLRIQPSKESQQQLDKSMQEQNNVLLYMEGLQKRKPLPPYRKERRRTIAVKLSNQEETAEKSKKKDAIEISDDETSDSESVVEIQQEEKKRMKVIFLKFHENNRPPYYGTQQKKSKMISPRNPLNKDEGLLNYEVDSDDEWEEEEPGESLSDDDSGDDDEADDGEEEDDGFMVPHGYLSDDEGIDAGDEENEVDSTSKEAQQLAKVKAWEAELKRKCKAKKPVCVGCVWPDEKNINEMLQQFEAFVLVDEPSIAIRTTSSATSVDSCFQPLCENIAATPDSVYKSGMFVPEEAMPDLIKLIHRSSAGVVKLMEYFKQHWSKKCENTKAYPTLAAKGHISKRQLEAKIKAIATKERRNDKPRWYVHDNILKVYGLEKLATIDNSQGMPHSSTSCSPQVLNTNTGIQVLTTSVSPSENKGQSSMIKMMTSPQLQTDNGGTQDNLKSISATLLSPVLQAQNKQLSAAPVARRRVVLQPIPTPEVGSGIIKAILPNLQNSSAGKSLQIQNDKQNINVKRRVVLQPVTKTEEGPGMTEANLQSSSAGQTLQVKRRVVLQSVAKLDVGGVSAKENQPTQQGISTECNIQLQNDKQLLVTPVAKRRVALQPVSKPDTAKDNPPPSGVKQICDNVEIAPMMSKTITGKPEEDITNINPPQGLMKTSLVSTVSISNSLGMPSSDEVMIPNDAGCISSAVKRTAPSPVGADRAAKVPRKSKESVQIHHVNTPTTTETTPAIVDMASCLQSQPQESTQKSISEAANLENSNSSKAILEGVLVKNSACKIDGVQPMEIEQIKA